MGEFDKERHHVIHGAQGANHIVIQDSNYFAMNGEQLDDDIEKLHSRRFAVSKEFRGHVVKDKIEKKFKARQEQLIREKETEMAREHAAVLARLAKVDDKLRDGSDFREEDLDPDYLVEENEAPAPLQLTPQEENAFVLDLNEEVDGEEALAEMEAEDETEDGIEPDDRPAGDDASTGGSPRNQVSAGRRKNKNGKH